MIGVCIKYYHENYGGMLQAFATIKFLEKKKIDYELIQYKKKKTIHFFFRSIPRMLNGVLLNDKYEALQKKISIKRYPQFKKNNEIRMKAFQKFKEDNFVKLSEVYIGYQKLCEGARKYQAVLTGSDQLWSPAGLPTNFYNLMFVPDDILKISYASSFGVKDIPFYQKKRTKEFLKRIDHISMRENRGSEIVKKLTGRNVPVVLDPVFLFDKEGWEQLIPNERLYEKPYLFAYFLGSDRSHRKVVKEFAKKKNIPIVTLRHLDQYVKADEEFGDIAPYDVGPAQFLNYLRGADYICTDSFHGAVFSILHRKKFLVFNRYSEGVRYSKNSRIDTLCQNLGICSRRYQKDLEKEMERNMDYDSVEKKYRILYREAKEYFDHVFADIHMDKGKKSERI